MQKTATLKDFKVFLFRTVLLCIVMSISFKVSYSQEGLTKPASAKKNMPTEKPAAAPQKINNIRLLKNLPAGKVNQASVVTTEATSGPTDVPALNAKYAEKMKQRIGDNAVPSIVPPTANLVNDVCTFTGSLGGSDATLSAGRFFRDGVPSTCAAPKAVCPGSFGTGPYFYDTYTMQNLTCASQCVTVTYLANGSTGNCFVTAYSGSFNPANLCTNYIADGGSSSLAAGTPVTFSFTLAANQTVVLVVNESNVSEASDSYTMTVTGINCAPPPPCQPATSSILSQVGGIPVASTPINETFNSVLPANWAAQNLSSPLGLTNWFQGNTAVFGANSGTGYIAANFNNTAGLGTISNWLFTPNVTLKNGDKFSFYTRTTDGTFPDRMQVRMSTNGTSTNVGASATSVGDFSTLLLDINPTYTSTGYPTAWTQYTLTLSGLPAAGVSGRLAFRYFVEGGGPSGNNSDYMGIDDVVYTTFSPGPITTCTGSTANLKVDITGGSGAAYNVTINANPGGNFTVNNYVSGSNIPVTPAGATTYTLVSVVQSDNPCCIGSGNTGTVTITPSATPTPGLVITASPSGPLCAGDPTLLNVALAPSTPVFSNTAPVLISSGPLTGTASGPASPYPSNITVSGLPTSGATVSSVSLTGLSHTWASDLDILLQSPTGQNVILLSDFGGSNDFVNTNITFSDAGATMPSSNPMPSGTFKPVNTAGPDNFPAPGPGSITNINPTLSTFTGDFNGQWKLFVYDQASGDTGRIAGGYSIKFNVPGGPVPAGYTYYWTPSAGLSTTTSVPVAASPMTTTTYTLLGTAPNGCQTTAAITINVNQLPAVTTPPASVSVCAGLPAVFTATATGAGIAYQWQVSTNNGVTWTNLTNGAPYSGVTTNTLTVNPTTTAMSGYRYRLNVSGTCPPVASSSAAILTVKALPVISYTPASPVCGGIAGVSGTQITAGSQAPPIPGTVTVNSGTVNIAVPDNTAAGATSNLTVAGVPANATITGMSVTLNMSHTYPGDMIFNLKAPNGQILNLYKYAGGSFTGTSSGPATWGWYGAKISSAGTVAFNSVTTAPFIYNSTTNWKADVLNGTVPGQTVQNPTGYVSAATSFGNLYSTPNGQWTLAMADGGPGDVGTLASWSVTIDYTTPGGAGSPLTYTWSPAAGLYTDPGANVPYVLGTQTQTVYAAPTNYTYYTITGSNSQTGCSDSAKVLVNYMPLAPSIVPSAVTMCLGDSAVMLVKPPATTALFNSGTINVAIPEGAFPNLPATAGANTIAVSGIPANAVVSSIAVKSNITHAYVGDVVMVLKAPNGQVINLDAILNKTNNPGANFVNTVISSTGTTALSAGTAPFTNTYKADLVGATFTAFGFTLAGGPVGYTPTATNWNALLSQLNGNWTLATYDVGAPDVGTLTNWELQITYTTGVPTSPATWSPITGLYLNKAATIAYTGDQRDTVYAKPAASTTYNVTVNGIGPDVTPTFSYTGAISTGDGSPGSPYPASVTVSGVPTTGVKVKSVTLKGLSHTWSDDIDVLLQSPTGTNVTLMSDVGSLASLNNVTYTFDDAGPAMSTTAGNPTGTYHPTNNAPADNYPAPGPGAISDVPSLSTFTGNFNGVWKLFVVDDTGGDTGSFAGGYDLTLVYPSVGCTSGAKQVPVTVNIPVTITTQPVNAVVCTDKVTTFTCVAAGTSPGHNWQYSTNNGNPGTWVTIANGGVFSGATTGTLTITAPPVSMNGWVFRDSVKGAAPCGAVPSFIARLTVNPLPTIVVTASPFTKLMPGMKTTLSSTVSPIAQTYTWLRNGATVPGASSSSLVVDVDGLGDYQLRVTDVNGCTNLSNIVSLTDSVSGKVFIYPNPNSGQFQVRYHSVINNSGLPRGINVYDARGKRVKTLTYSIAAPYARMDVDLRNHGAGVYWIEVVDTNGDRLAMGRVAVVR